MAGTGYEIFALFMRYVFVALGALVLLRGLLWMRKDARAWRKEIRNLPDAGLVGELKDPVTEKSYPLPREGVLGAKRSCDIRIKGPMMPKKAFTFLFVDGKGLAITPIGGQNVYLDGEVVRGNKGYALHGTQLEVGGMVLRVRLFSGLNVPKRVLFRPGEDEDDSVFDGPSPFEEVAGLFAPAQDEWTDIPGQFEQNPFMDEMMGAESGQGMLFAPQQYPNDENMYTVPMNEGTRDEPYMPEGMPDAPQGYPPHGVMPTPDETPVRRRRSDRYL